MSGKFVRASAYRHVFGKAPKPDGEFSELRPQFNGDGNFITANDKYFAYAGAGGGGPVVVWSLNNPCRLPIVTPALLVHKDVVLDFEFSPFNSNLLATSSEDTHVKVSAIPEGGLKSNLTESVVDLEGHERKVNLIHWHPTASNILASASYDLTLKVWDVERQLAAHTITDHSDTIYSFDWNHDGSLLCSTSKDLSLRVFDPRTNSDAIQKTASFTGTKSSRALWAGDKGKIIAVGASKQSARQYSVWDVKMLNQPLVNADIDNSAGSLIPYFDADNNILYVAGKGDGNIRYFELTDTDPYIHYLSEYRDNASQKGICFLPKRSCNTKECEVAVALRLMKDKVIPISFQVPRRSADNFQKDIYPDAYAGIPSATAQEYLSGVNKPPVKVSMNPANKGNGPAQSASPVSLSVQKSPAELQRELDAANARIKELEAELAKLKA
jgi:coronin-1B/1C/6